MSLRSDPKLPYGGATIKDLSKLPLEQVEHEYDLAFEILNGCYVDGELVIPGMLNVESTGESHDAAVLVWKRRLEVAYNELVERQILS